MTEKSSLQIEDVRPYEQNAKEHTNKQLLQLANVVREVGWRQPTMVNQKGIIVVGHGRYLTWKKHTESHGLKPIWVMDDMGRTISGGPETTPMTDDQERMWRLADNELAKAKYDRDILVTELKLLPMPMVELTGLNPNLLLETVEDKPNLGEIGTARSVVGDIYELGVHRLICGDSTEPETYKKLLGEERARMVFTDPPYAISYETENTTKFGGTAGKLINDDKTPAEALEFYRKVSRQLHTFSANDATLYWWYANRLTDVNMQALRETGWHFSQIVMWLKNGLIFSPNQLFHRIYEPCMVLWKENGGGHYQDLTFSNYTELWNLDKKDFAEHLDMWYQKRDKTNTYIHPTQKPVQLAERAIKRSSAKGDIILDAFGGSGSTMIACDQLDRQARLIELDPRYVDAIVGRWCQYSETTKVVKNGEEIIW